MWAVRTASQKVSVAQNEVDKALIVEGHLFCLISQEGCQGLVNAHLGFLRCLCRNYIKRQCRDFLGFNLAEDSFGESIKVAAINVCNIELGV